MVALQFITVIIIFVIGVQGRLDFLGDVAPGMTNLRNDWRHVLLGRL